MKLSIPELTETNHAEALEAAQSAVLAAEKTIAAVYAARISVLAEVEVPGAVRVDVFKRSGDLDYYFFNDNHEEVEPSDGYVSDDLSELLSDAADWLQTATEPAELWL